MAGEEIKAVVTADTAQFESSMRKAAGHAKSLSDTMRGAVLKLGAVVGVDAVIGAFNTIRNGIDELNDRAARLEMPVEDLQRLEAAATMSGSSVETLAKALSLAERNAVKARQGSDGLQSSFAALGINVSDFLAADPTSRLLSISKGFNAATDKAGAYKAVFDVLGKGAGELVPLLRDGEAGIAAISSRLKVLGSEDVAAVARLNDEIDMMAANVKTDLAGAFIALRPQIESFVKLLADAADGFAIFADPAGGIGRGGGDSGGLAILKEIDRLNVEIPKLKANLSGKSWWEGVGDLQLSLKNDEAALAALQARYAGLSVEARAYAEQLRGVELAKAAGLSGDALQSEVAALTNRTAETLRAAQNEKDLAIAAADANAQLESQAAAAKSAADALDGLQSKVAGRVLALQSPQVRGDFARQQLGGILKEQNVGSVDDLRKKVGTSKTDEERVASLKALDEALNRLEEIKRAQGEIDSQATEHWQNWKKAIDASADAARDAEQAGSDLVKNAAEAEKEKADAFKEHVAAALAMAAARAAAAAGEPLQNPGSFREQRATKLEADKERRDAERNIRADAVRAAERAKREERRNERDGRFPKAGPGIEQKAKQDEAKRAQNEKKAAEAKGFEKTMEEMAATVGKIEKHFIAIGAA